MGASAVLTREIGGSINDFMTAVRAAFEKQFPPKRVGDRTTEWYWIRDIFEDAVIVNEEAANQLYRVAMMQGSDGITFEPKNKWTKVKLTYASEMVTDSIITEFKGKPPDVPVREGVNLEALTEGDTDPVFITLQISEVGKISANGLIHDDELTNSLVTQINGQAAEGIMGHIKEADRSTAFPVSDVHWLGAVRQGTQAWAKGYIPKTAVAQREHFRILRHTNGRAATSIAGPAVREFVDKKKGTWKAKDFRLEQLDFAPYTRAALKPSGDFVLTREMAAYSSEGVEEMGKEEIIRELVVGDIPQAIREQIIAEHTAAAAPQQRITVLETELKKHADMVAELTTQLEGYIAKDFETAVDAKVAELTNWNVTEDADKKKVEALRKNIRARILSEMGDDHNVERLTSVSELVWADFQLIAESVRDQLAGPATVVGGKGKGGNVASKTKADDVVKRAKELRKQHGI